MGHRQTVNITMRFSPAGKDVLFPGLIRTDRFLWYHYGHLRKKFLNSVLLRGILKNRVFSLESRLDSFLFRVGIVTSYIQARQLISHGKIRVNGRPVNRPGHILNEGDFVCVNPSQCPVLVDSFFSRDPSRRFWYNVPKYLLFDYRQFVGIYLYDPTLLEIPFPVTIA